VIGQQIGPYEIIAALGEGGMGAVYRARDTKLNRDVALKVLLPDVANDPERLARFQREAQVLASINHPHIGAIHGLEESGDTTALVLELVDGPTLAEVLARPDGRALQPSTVRDVVRPNVGDGLQAVPHHGLPLEDALSIAKQIAEALEAAHEKGIIHRDLKPANIKVRDDGTVKVLDFGLAKALDSDRQSASGLSISPTITSPAMTQAGVILGTAAYMAPEQARGRAIDRRADIWAFGCVLYEMLTGRRAFDGEDTADVLSRVLQREPDWDVLPGTTPAHVRTLLQRCFEKDPRKRLPHIAIVGFELDRPASDVSPSATAAPRSRALVIAGAILAVAVAAAGAGFVAASYRQAAPAAQVIRSLVAVPDTTPAPLAQSSIAVSPDGRRLAFAYPDANGRSMLWVRGLDSLDAQPLAGTEDAQMPFWSPDGRYLAFRAGPDSQLKRVDVTSGGVITLVDGGGAPGDWSPDGTILFPYKGGIYRVPAEGGKPVAVPGKTQYYPSFLPDGRHYLHTNGRKVYLGSLDSADHPVLIEGAGNAIYADRHIFFTRETTLYAQPFDPQRLSLSGSPVVVAERIRVNTGNGAGTFSVSPGGVLAYVTNRTTTSRLTWFDRAGREVGTVGEPGVFWNVHLSRDGRWAAGSLGPSEDARAVWLYDVSRGIRTRVTRDDADDTDPAVSPDGSLVVFSSRRGPLKSLDVKALAGSAAAERLTEDGQNKYPQDWSPDGRHLVYTRFSGATTLFDLWTIDMKGDRTPRPLVQTSAYEIQAALSPDGKWVAYTSNESGRFEVHLTAFPAGGPGRQVTSSGGTSPHWSPDGRELFFLSRSTLMRATVTASPSGLDVGVPAPLFDLTSRLGDLGGQLPWPSNLFSVAPDGQRFLFAVPQRLMPEVITIVVNWQAALRDRASATR